MADIKATTPAPAAGQPVAPAAPAVKAGTGSTLFGMTALKEKFQAVIKAGPQQLDIGLLNQALTLTIGILIIVFVIGFSRSWKELQRLSRYEFVINATAKKESGFKEIATMKGVAYYIGKLSGRDIFRRKAKADQATNEPVFSSKMADMTADLKLVGISISDDPDAMIEDTKLQRTFFVKMGSMVGDLRVDLITRDYVVLKYNKEKFELK